MARNNKPSGTARKVALNLVTLGSKPGMETVLPPESADTTARLLVAAGVVPGGIVRFARSSFSVSIYERCDCTPSNPGRCAAGERRG